MAAALFGRSSRRHPRRDVWGDAHILRAATTPRSSVHPQCEAMKASKRSNWPPQSVGQLWSGRPICTETVEAEREVHLRASHDDGAENDKDAAEVQLGHRCPERGGRLLP